MNISITPTELMLNILFGVIAMAYLIYGKKQGKMIPLGCGLAMSLGSFFIESGWIQLGVALVLTILPWVWRES